jgi:hypothetical protein
MELEPTRNWNVFEIVLAEMLSAQCELIGLPTLCSVLWLLAICSLPLENMKSRNKQLRQKLGSERDADSIVFDIVNRLNIQAHDSQNI